ncbi:MAG: methyltransferase [Deltaproteobacteria bacterium]|nr:methyltransferase [Deltaproteobacteria bacterium]
MIRRRKKYRQAYGVRLLLSQHPEIRKLKHFNAPSVHGNRLWKSTWLLMDYLHRRGLPKDVRVMEVGCGWGLLGIYCAKKYGVKVTSVDVDPEVIPYLKLHARINEVDIATVRKDFDGLRTKHLQKIDVLIGADICFWDTLVKPLKNLILRALRARVKQVLISDPGRPPFEEVAEYFISKKGGEILDWTAQRPRRSEGRILKIGNMTNLRS